MTQIHRYQAMQRIVQAAAVWNRNAYVEDVIETMLGEEILPLLLRYQEIFPEENIGIWGGTHDAFVQHHPRAWNEILRTVASEYVIDGYYTDRKDLVDVLVGKQPRICDWDPEEVVRHWLNNYSDAEIDFTTEETR